MPVLELAEILIKQGAQLRTCTDLHSADQTRNAQVNDWNLITSSGSFWWQTGVRATLFVPTPFLKPYKLCGAISWVAIQTHATLEYTQRHEETSQRGYRCHSIASGIMSRRYFGRSP